MVWLQSLVLCSFFVAVVSWALIGAPYTRSEPSTSETHAKERNRESSEDTSVEFSLESIFSSASSTEDTTDDGTTQSEDQIDHKEFTEILSTLSQPYISNFLQKEVFNFKTESSERKRHGSKVRKSVYEDACSAAVHLSSPSGQIMSPGYDSSGYDDNLNCQWYLEVPHNSGIKLYVERVSIEYDSNCGYDSLKIEWAPVESNIPSREEVLCGEIATEEFSFGPGMISLKFTTDGAVTENGFLLMYEADTHGHQGSDDPCAEDGVTLQDYSGTVNTPGFDGNRQYENGMLCQWKIIGSPGNKVMLTFEYMDIEEGPSYCYDGLTIYDGGPMDNELVVLCGRNVPDPIVSTSNELTLSFHSDESEGRAGFKATYQLTDDTYDNTNNQNYNQYYASSDTDNACEGGQPIVLTDTEGQITAPTDSSGQYKNNVECIWKIILPDSSSKLELQLTNVDVEDGAECQYDSLTVYDGPSENAVPRKYCGQMGSMDVTLSGNSALIKLKTDSSVTGTGFTIHYHTKDDVYEYETSGESCGLPVILPHYSRIVNGEEAAPHSWPWQISLVRDDYHTCGGSIISREWILTASHCVDGTSNWEVRIIVGEHSLGIQDGYEQTFEVSEIYMHPSYNSQNKMDHDIALLKLSGQIQYNDRVLPVCLPRDDVEVGYMCTVTGWGDTMGTGNDMVLNQVDVPILSQAKCRRPQWYYDSITDDMVCAGYRDGGKDSCQGDSGGPLVCRISNSYYVQEGVVSWGAGCADIRKPGVYARVPFLLDWIVSTTGGMVSIK